MEFKLYQPLAIHELGKRDNQEDCIYPLFGKASANDRLFIVCDGMGGHEKGEVASQTICQSLSNFFSNRVSHSDPLDDATLKEALEYGYQELDRKDDSAFQKMGTTLTLIYFHRGGVTCAHIGDSRIYHIRPGIGILYLSRDHSLVFDLYQSGEITYDEMRTSPQKNIITRAIQPGKDNRVLPDIIHITNVQPGDYFYLCSDGMLEQMNDEELSSLLSSNASDEKKKQILMAETLDNKDNHSAYILHIESVTREAGDEKLIDEEPLSRCNALNIKPVLTKGITTKETSFDDVEIIERCDSQPVRQTNQTPPPSKRRSFLPTLLFFALLLIGGLVGYTIMKDKQPDYIISDPTPPPSHVDTIKQLPETNLKQPITNSDSKKPEIIRRSAPKTTKKQSSKVSTSTPSSSDEAKENSNNADQQQKPQSNDGAKIEIPARDMEYEVPKQEAGKSQVFQNLKPGKKGNDKQNTPKPEGNKKQSISL